MPWHRVRLFVLRRFAPGEYLGLHLTLGLLLSLITLAAFLVVTHSIREDQGELVRFDAEAAEAMEQHAQEHPALLHLLRIVTWLGGVPVMVLINLTGSVVLMLRHRRFFGTVWLLAALAGALIDQAIKAGIERHRPTNPDAAVTETNASFPSGHAMGSLVGYGLLGYFLMLRLRRRWARAAAVTGLVLLVLTIGFSRVYLRAHYVSDVIGGFCVGTVWLTACISGLELVRRRRRPSPGPVESLERLPS
jgi:undecaprenyl-diphosphatase